MVSSPPEVQRRSQRAAPKDDAWHQADRMATSRGAAVLRAPATNGRRRVLVFDAAGHPWDAQRPVGPTAPELRSRHARDDSPRAPWPFAGLVDTARHQVAPRLPPSCARVTAPPNGSTSCACKPMGRRFSQPAMPVAGTTSPRPHLPLTLLSRPLPYSAHVDERATPADTSAAGWCGPPAHTKPRFDPETV